MHGDRHRDWGMLFIGVEYSGWMSSLCVQTTHTCIIDCEAISTSQLHGAPGSVGSCTSNGSGQSVLQASIFRQFGACLEQAREISQWPVSCNLMLIRPKERNSSPGWSSEVPRGGYEGTLMNIVLLIPFPAILFPVHLTVSDKVYLD